MKRYPAYRDSGIEWMGEIPEGWNIKPMKYCVDINSETLPETTSEDREIHYVDISNVSYGQIVEHHTTYRFTDAPSRARRIVHQGDTIVSTVRTYLKAIAQIDSDDPDLIVSTGFAVLSPNGQVQNRFLYYLAMSQPFVDRVCAESVGVSYPAVNASDIAQIPLWFPLDIEEQHAIAAYLDRKTQQIDRLIDIKRRQIALLREERTAVINQAVTKGLNPYAPMKDSGIAWIGEIPEGWEVKRLKWIIQEKLKYGANESGDQDISDHPRYIRITDFDESGSLRHDTFRSLPPEIATDYLLAEGDILFARSGATVGKSFQFKGYNGTACFAGYLIKAIPDSNEMASDFLYLYTRSGAYENWRNSIFSQATIQNISADKYQDLPVPVPPLHEQSCIIEHLNIRLQEIDRSISQAEGQIELLQEYRTTLISDAVTGKIDVREEAAA